MAEVFIQYTNNFRLDDITNIISDQRMKKIRRLKNRNQAMLSAAAELALNRAVKAWFPQTNPPVEYYYDKNGKPYLLNHDAYISLSHSGEAAICAISHFEVGADIQKIRCVDIRVAERFFSEEKLQKVLNSENRELEFCRMWSAAEARVKLTGEGISLLPVIKDEDCGNFRYTELLTDDKKYVIAVCEAVPQNAYSVDI